MQTTPTLDAISYSGYDYSAYSAHTGSEIGTIGHESHSVSTSARESPVDTLMSAFPSVPADMHHYSTLVPEGSTTTLASAEDYTSPLTPLYGTDGTCHCAQCLMGANSGTYSYTGEEHVGTPASTYTPTTSFGDYQMAFEPMPETDVNATHFAAPRRGSKVENDMIDFDQYIGRLAELAMTPDGSSYLHAALRQTRLQPHQFLALVQELQPSIKQLLYDTNGIPVVYSMLSAMTQWNEFQQIGAEILADPMLLYFLLCNYWKIICLLMHQFGAAMCQPIIDAVCSAPRDIGLTQQGCVSIQRVLDVTQPQQAMAICRALVPFVCDMAVDMYGNYVVQCVLEKGPADIIAQLVRDAIVPRIHEMSCNKFASNVVEKCFHTPDVATQMMVYDAIYGTTTDVCEKLVNDPYGNFVVQSSLTAVQDEKLLGKMRDRLKPLLQNCQYGAKIEFKMKQRQNGKSKEGNQLMESNRQYNMPRKGLGGKNNSQRQETPLSTISVNTQSFMGSN